MNNIISEIELTYKPVIAKQERIKISNSQDAFKAILSNWNKNTIELHEEFKVLLLNRANEVLGVHTVSKGGITATVVDIRILFAVALKSASTSIVLAHNHPSGNLKPSEADKKLYEKVKKASEYLDIQVLDNMIITKAGFYSFADRNLI